MRRKSTGINGLDQVLDGGFIAPSTVLIAGTAGTGKTTFIMQSLFNAAHAGERCCLFVPILSEPPAMIDQYMSQFTFYSHDLIEDRRVTLVNLDASVLGSTESILDFISVKLEQLRPTRVAIDPVNALTVMQNLDSARMFWYELFTRFKGWGLLTMLTGEYTHAKLDENPISYLADGIIELSTIEHKGKTRRYLHVRKLRGVAHDIDRRFFELGADGFDVLGTVYIRPDER